MELVSLALYNRDYMETQLGHLVESYRFWDIVTLWSKEKLENEEIVARALARGIIRDGLKFQSVDTRWVKTIEMEFDGDPYVGFVAKPGEEIVVLRADSLEHLLKIVRIAKTPSRRMLKNEFVLKNDFKDWLKATGQPLPTFWFSEK